MESLDELRDAVQRNPRRVADAAVWHVSRARERDDPAALSQALGVLGRARRALGDITLAESDLVAAVVAAGEAENDELAADAHIGLAGVLIFAARTDEAFTHLDLADLLGSPKLRAYASLQRAALSQHIGRVDDALAAYDQALPTLRELDAPVDLAMVLMNRGVIRAQGGACDEAITDLLEAGALFERGGHAYGVAQTEHGLGWAYARAGDLPRALQHLDRAAEQFQALGRDALEVDVDRVDVLLGAGLFAAARDLARETAARASVGGDHSHAAQMWLLGARASFLDGDSDAGAADAERARLLFVGQGSTGWEHAARLELLRATSGAGDEEELRELARGLARAGHARGAATALALAAIAASRAGATEPAAALATECSEQADRLGVFEIRVLAAHARATSAVALGDLTAARDHVRAGLADLERHRASLGATDAQASVAIHARQLAELGVRLALATGSASSVLEWVERARAGRRRHASVRPLDDAAGAAELTELRGVVAAMRLAEAGGNDTVDLLHRQRDLERAVYRRHLRADGGPTVDDEWSPPAADTLRTTLAGASLLTLAEIDGRLVGVCIDERGTRLSDLGPAARVRDVAATIASALRSTMTPGRSSARAAGPDALLDRALTVLDQTIRDLVEGDGPVVLVVPAVLHTVPWQLVPCLAERDVCVAPSASWWFETKSAGRTAATGPVVVAAGPRLAEASREAVDVGACYPRSIVLTGRSATTAAVAGAFGDAPAAHIASHGQIRYDNALWSSLELSDGPLYVHDLERIRPTPELVVLSGCDTGVGVRAGDELLGLSSALLGNGTRTLVASLSVLPDSVETREVMVAFHQAVAGGASPSSALAELARTAMQDRGAMPAAALGCFGMP